MIMMIGAIRKKKIAPQMPIRNTLCHKHLAAACVNGHIPAVLPGIKPINHMSGKCTEKTGTRPDLHCQMKAYPRMPKTTALNNNTMPFCRHETAGDIGNHRPQNATATRPVSQLCWESPTKKPTIPTSAATMGTTKRVSEGRKVITAAMILIPISHYQCRRSGHIPSKGQGRGTAEWHQALPPVPS